jgi:hypothetical protein
MVLMGLVGARKDEVGQVVEDDDLGAREPLVVLLWGGVAEVVMAATA